MQAQVRKTIIQHQMLAPRDRVLVAVSGGIDSVTLLHLLCVLREEFSLSLAVAHLDHQLRSDSAKDAKFVSKLAEQLKLLCFIERADVRGLAAIEKRTTEEAARKARYAFLERAARTWEANTLAVGHTLNDQVETFLMRLLRGAGLEGLKGIPTMRALNPSLTLIRPLIDCARTQIEAYAKEHKLTYREDPTNRENSFTRNKIRHQLLPWLVREFNPNLYNTIARTQKVLAQASQFLDMLSENNLNELIRDKTRDSLTIDRAGFNRLDKFLKSLVLRKALYRLGRKQTEISFDHIERIIQALVSKERLRLELPGAIRLQTRSSRIVLRQGEQRSEAPYCWLLNVPGETVLAEIGWRFSCQFMSKTSFMQAKNTLNSASLEAYVDFDTIKGNLHVRNRRPGDRWAPLGLKGKKKLQDFFVDEKIAAEERDRVPLLCDGISIVWVVGWRTSHLHRIRRETRSVLKISAGHLEEEAACRS
ncbi:tRNA lysidine(34) synthetase TilS [Candidatus Acetothermia bacterium]|nr:tRNA lysidine(34) synthetase TilS [Candidatus Acetothermia bacterium]MBI3659376.1 tRNA lysidine(34) synthetase TilS [Candidatus Acetothermia bacterium]